MALRFIDSVAHYNGTGIPRKWTDPFLVSWNSSGGRRNAPNLSVTGGHLLKTLTHSSRYIVGAAIQYQSLGGPNLSLANASAPIAELLVNADSTVSVLAGNNRIGTSPIAVADIGSWHYYEMDTTLGQNGGGTLTCTASVRVDGASFGTFVGASNILTTNLIDGAPTANQCGIITSGTLKLMDFYCCDTSTTDINGFASTNTAFLGDVEIDAEFPGADVTTQMSTTGGDGTHAYTCVNDNPPDDDTSYVSTTNTSTNNKEAFTYTPISGFTGTILGAQYLVLARKDAEGPRIIDMTVGTHTASTVEFLGTANYLSDFYVY